MPGDYAKFKIQGHGLPVRTVILRIESEGRRFIRGRRVTRDGGYTDYIEIIDKEAIIERRVMVMNLHYGWLEEI